MCQAPLSHHDMGGVLLVLGKGGLEPKTTLAPGSTEPSRRGVGGGVILVLGKGGGGYELVLLPHPSPLMVLRLVLVAKRGKGGRWGEGEG